MASGCLVYLHVRGIEPDQQVCPSHSDVIAEIGDIDALFASGRSDIKSDTDLMKAIRQLLIEKVIAPCAIETSGDAQRRF